MTGLHKLRVKLCRELAQSEHDARVHPVREARRLGDTAPAHALLAIADHAEELQPRFASLMMRDRPRGLGLGRTVGAAWSALRHAIFDRLVDTERSYRGTLLGLRHGIGVARLLREVAARERDTALVRFCDELLADRLFLMEDADRALDWFADEPRIAITSGLRLALAPPALRLRAPRH